MSNMTEEQIKIITDGLAAASKLGTVNALTYLQKGFEAFKVLEIPLLNQTGECYGLSRPYRKEGVREFVDFMLVYLDEAIKGLEGNKGE